MADNTKNRDQQIHLRVTAASKSLYMRAAELSGEDLSTFIIEAAYKHAVQTIAEHERVVLNNQARDVFLNALTNPPAPNENLRRAAAKYTMK